MTMPETETQTATQTQADASAQQGEEVTEAAAPVEDRSHLPLERRIEAILMVADEPQGAVHLATALRAPVKQVKAAIEALRDDYDGKPVGDRPAGPERGFELREVGGGWRIYVRDAYDVDAADFVLTQTPTKLSQAALETLAVIAYKQPITRGAVAAIRAVNVDSVVRTLLGRGLIREAFADSETGAINYETTELLLTQLGLNSLDELPPISPLLPDGEEDMFA
ncbi:SMC-Scp complex subunit ScpB [Agrococcus sp. KRD186]|jgi:segregation and condensation protein B|uniref:SMC-Scp complex subunit ScpB n=1 Tax=Agrococcus sp. KRD186 TaxID=2729730 RepID=UPI0019CF675F|nr:SMC-Scp complex subunit ScpB [Agrococcus sp. KRD186]